VEAGSRRELLQGALLGALGTAVAPAANAAGDVTRKDYERVIEGYKGLTYLVDNWLQETRDCSMAVGGNVAMTLQSGTVSPNACVASPLIIRNYLGCSKMDHPLFQSEKLWVKIQNSDQAPDDVEAFLDAWEDFEKHKRNGDEWAYTSSWGEANPGGGRDKVEEYLLKSQKEVVLAKDALGKIAEMLKLKIA
jgi:Ca2+ transporting ATPase